MQHVTPQAGSQRARARRLTRDELKRCRPLLESGQLQQFAYETDFDSEQDCLFAIGHALGLDVVDLTKAEPEPDCLNDFPVRLIHRYNVFPLRRSGGLLTLAVGNPFDTQAVDAVAAATDEIVTPVLAQVQEI